MNNSRPNGHEPPVSLFSVAKFGGFGFREQEPKAQILKKSVGRVLTRNPYSLVNTDCLLMVPVLGAQHLVPSETPPVVLLLCHSHDELVVRLIYYTANISRNSCGSKMGIIVVVKSPLFLVTIQSAPLAIAV